MTAFFIFPLTILLTLGGLIFVVVSYFKRNPETDELESKFLVLSYFYIAILISSFLIFWGVALNIKAGLAYGFDVPFSYQGELRFKESPVSAVESEKTSVPTPPEPEFITYQDKIREKSILQGSMFLIFGVIFFVVHEKALRYILKGKIHKFLSRAYHLLGTLVYGGITVVTVPMSIYAALERVVFKVSVTPQNFYQQQLPGELLAYAIPGIIIWYLFFKKIMKEV